MALCSNALKGNHQISYYLNNFSTFLWTALANFHWKNIGIQQKKNILFKL